jgi:hypothetical protein
VGRPSDGATTRARGVDRPSSGTRFADALRKARASGRSPRGLGAESAEASAPSRPSARRAAADAKDGVLLRHREEARDCERTASPAAPTPPLLAPDLAVSELRAVVRALPVAVETFGVRDGAPLSLSFGRSLEVELRASPRGVELLLRPERRLARACEAELGALVSALAARGVAVARAGVRARSVGAGAQGPRVDVHPGLR